MGLQTPFSPRSLLTLRHTACRAAACRMVDARRRPRRARRAEESVSRRRRSRRSGCESPKKGMADRIWYHLVSFAVLVSRGKECGPKKAPKMDRVGHCIGFVFHFFPADPDACVTLFGVCLTELAVLAQTAQCHRITFRTCPIMATDSTELFFVVNKTTSKSQDHKTTHS